MLKIKPELTGERFVPHMSNKEEVLVNLERYSYALHHLEGKKVLDLGCGSGLGTYLYSLVASEVVAFDYNSDALRYLKQFPIEDEKLGIITGDIEKSIHFPEVDVCVALEIFEHLEDPESVLKNLKAKELVFSLPLSSLGNSKWHKYDIKGGQEGINQIIKLIGKYYKVEKYHQQYDRWIFGHGIRKKLC